MQKKLMPFCAAAIFAFCICAKASTNVIYSDDKVTVTETLHSYIPFSAHVGISDTISIAVFDKTYENVRGYIPFYLTIPENNSILFVTGRDYDNGQAEIHLVNLNTKKEIHFQAYNSHLGSNIRQTNDWCYERIESLKDDKVIISAGRTNCQFRYYLDLKNSKFEKEEAEFWNSFSDTTNRYVYVGGKRPKD
jgi:hypothetical protein